MRKHAIVIAIGLGLAAPASATTINPVYATSYTGQDYGIGPIVSLAGNSQAQAAINAAASQISSLFPGTNTTVNIAFYGAHDGTSGFLGASISGQVFYTYQGYTGALKANLASHPTNSGLASAVANLPKGNGGNTPALSLVLPTTPDARALGLGGAQPEFSATGAYTGSGSVDGVVFLNLDQPLSYTRPIPPVSGGIMYDAQTTMEHEIDEIMGIGGAGSTLNDYLFGLQNGHPDFFHHYYGIPAQYTVLGPMDLYRYKADGQPSFLLDPQASPQTAWFSIDGGKTSLDSFNQQYMKYGDAADWGLFKQEPCPGNTGHGGSGHVQDAFSCNNRSADVTTVSPEYYAYEAIGYDPSGALLAGTSGYGAGATALGQATFGFGSSVTNPVPEAPTFLVFAATLASFGFARRRAKARQ